MKSCGSQSLYNAFILFKSHRLRAITASLIKIAFKMLFCIDSRRCAICKCMYMAVCYTLSTLGLLLTMHVMTEELEVYFYLGDLHSEVYEHKPKNMQAGINWPHYVNTQQGRHVHPETTLRKVTWQLRMSTISCSI